MQQIVFLSSSEIVNINADQTKRFGGMHKIRDLSLLESAVHRPQAQFNGNFLCSDIFEMAAVYAHGIIKNHPFIDGNKRTGVVSALLFLSINNFDLSLSNDELVTLGVEIAINSLNQKQVAEILRESC